MSHRDGAFRQPTTSSARAVDVPHRIGAQGQRGPADGARVDVLHPRDRAIVALAARQHGVVTTAQLLDAGVGRRAIAGRVERGWLVPQWRGVYQVGPTTGRYGREMAAVLACGHGAALSHQTAAAIWGIRRGEDGDVHVTVRGQARRSRPGIRVHRTVSLDAAVKHCLPLTTPSRTLRDLKAVLTSEQLDRALEQAQVLGLIHVEGAPEPEFTRSKGERRLKALCKAAGLAVPRMNAIVAGWEADAFWPAAKLVVEIDGWNFHRSRQAFERDRRKDAELTGAGYRVVRITWRRLDNEPYSVTAQLAVLLATPA